MSQQEVQKVVIAKLRASAHPLRVVDLINQIRNENPALGLVPDFDFRSAVLALTANGQIRSTSTNQIEVPAHAVAARG